MDDKLGRLLEKFEYDELSKPDRTYVLTQISRIEYERFYRFLKYATSVLNYERSKITPLPIISSNLKLALRAKGRKHTIWGLSLPTLNFNSNLRPYQIALAMVSGVFLIFIFTNKVWFKDKREVTTAMNLDELKGFHEMNQYLSFDESCLNLELIIPETNINISTVDALYLNSSNNR